MQRIVRLAHTFLLMVVATGCDSGSSADVLYALEDVAPQPVPLAGWAAVSKLYDYPVFASRAGIDGTVRVAVTVGLDGLSQDPRVSSSPNELLSEHALQSLRATVWEPGRIGDEATLVRDEVCVQYELEGSGAEAVGTSAFGWCGS